MVGMSCEHVRSVENNEVTPGTPNGCAECLERLARVACAQGQPERATRLCAAAAALREAIGAPLPPAERPHFDQTVATARVALGADAFASAWEHGRTLPLEQVIATMLKMEAR